MNNLDVYNELNDYCKYVIEEIKFKYFNELSYKQIVFIDNVLEGNVSEDFFDMGDVIMNYLSMGYAEYISSIDLEFLKKNVVISKVFSYFFPISDSAEFLDELNFANYLKEGIVEIYSILFAEERDILNYQILNRSSTLVVRLLIKRLKSLMSASDVDKLLFTANYREISSYFEGGFSKCIGKGITK